MNRDEIQFLLDKIGPEATSMLWILEQLQPYLEVKPLNLHCSAEATQCGAECGVIGAHNNFAHADRTVSSEKMPQESATLNPELRADVASDSRGSGQILSVENVKCTLADTLRRSSARHAQSSFHRFLLKQRVFCEWTSSWEICFHTAKVVRKIDGHDVCLCYDHDPEQIQAFHEWLTASGQHLDSEDFIAWLKQREDSI